MINTLLALESYSFQLLIGHAGSVSTHRPITKISHISSIKFGQLILSKMVKMLPPDDIF